MKKIFLAALATIGLQACTTPYQEMGASGGVEATIIDDNVFQVRASVNGYTHKSIANQYALRKAAEVSKSLGVVISQLLTIQARVTIKNISKVDAGLKTTPNGALLCLKCWYTI